MTPDPEAQERSDDYHRGRQLEFAGMRAEACRIYGTVSAGQIAHGLPAQIPLSAILGPKECLDVLLTYLPYLPQVDEDQCWAAPIRDHFAMTPEDVEAAETDVRKWNYLIGLQWFRWGHPSKALQCFQLPPDHPFANLAKECVDTIRSNATAGAPWSRGAQPE